MDGALSRAPVRACADDEAVAVAVLCCAVRLWLSGCGSTSCTSRLGTSCPAMAPSQATTAGCSTSTPRPPSAGKMPHWAGRLRRSSGEWRAASSGTAAAAAAAAEQRGLRTTEYINRSWRRPPCAWPALAALLRRRRRRHTAPADDTCRWMRSCLVVPSTGVYNNEKHCTPPLFRYRHSPPCQIIQLGPISRCRPGPHHPRPPAVARPPRSPGRCRPQAPSAP
jgi:hypothetical protein